MTLIPFHRRCDASLFTFKVNAYSLFKILDFTEWNAHHHKSPENCADGGDYEGNLAAGEDFGDEIAAVVHGEGYDVVTEKEEGEGDEG